MSFRGGKCAEGKTSGPPAGTPEVTQMLLLLMFSDLVMQNLVLWSKLTIKIPYEMCAVANLAEILLHIYRYSISAVRGHGNMTGHDYCLLLGLCLYRSACCVTGSGSQIRKPSRSQHSHFCSSTLSCHVVTLIPRYRKESENYILRSREIFVLCHLNDDKK